MNRWIGIARTGALAVAAWGGAFALQMKHVIDTRMEIATLNLLRLEEQLSRRTSAWRGSTSRTSLMPS